MKVEVDKIYQCGDNKVLIIADLIGNPRHKFSRFSIVGILLDKSGLLDCSIGMFDGSGNPYQENPATLYNNLKELPNKFTTLRLERIAKIEEELAQLKLELQKEK